ncbi:M15 family metallopeptidase [Nocardia sp. NBC_01503]|uniref:M15 family metallopeptidase n=1 Tax=Nocardia sp. NBC_01503 TaxID=2975997 RepID=UPI003FA5C43C
MVDAAVVRFDVPAAEQERGAGLLADVPVARRGRAVHGASRAAAVAVIAGAGLFATGLPAASPLAHADSAVAVPGSALSESAVGGAAGKLPSASAIAGETDGLDPLLAAAYSHAADAAREEGVTIRITSGYRSPAEQQAMWEDGIRQYGSPEAARQWVLPPEESTHVSGQAIDVGPRAGAQWLEDNGNRWGLCRTFDNEWWHFELVTVPGASCPARLPDASVR